jgi:hypothetical protein
MNRQKFLNLIFFSLLISIPTLLGAMCGYWLCLMVFVKGKSLIPFEIPEWIFWIAGGIIPVATLLQNLAIFKFYLILQDLGNPKLKQSLLDFLCGFLPVWSILLCWTLFWSTVCKIGHLPPRDEMQLLFNVVTGYVAGLPLLINAFIAAASVGIFIAFVLQALRNLLQEYSRGRKLSGQGIQAGDSGVATGNQSITGG